MWTKLDLVLLGDVSTPSLLRPLRDVTQRRVGRMGLTGHSGTHDPGVWRRSGLADYLDEEGVSYERYDTLRDVAAALT